MSWRPSRRHRAPNRRRLVFAIPLLLNSLLVVPVMAKGEPAGEAGPAQVKEHSPRLERETALHGGSGLEPTATRPRTVRRVGKDDPSPEDHDARAAQSSEGEAFAPTGMGGYTLPRLGFALKVEAGHPNLDVGVLFAAASRIQLELAYRTVYGLTHSPHAGIKLQLLPRQRGPLGVALEVVGGYSHVRRHVSKSSWSGKNEVDYEMGGGIYSREFHWYGEFWLRGTAHRGRHGFYFGLGVRVSQNPGWMDKWVDSDSVWGWNPFQPFMASLSLELGYTVRVNRYASFYVVSGVDVFFRSNFIPGLPRLRLGVILGS